MSDDERNNHAESTNKEDGEQPKTVDISVFLAHDSEQLLQFSKEYLLDRTGKLLLVPVDFSEHAAAALQEACELAQLMSANLVVLHVVHDPSDMPDYYSKVIKSKRVAHMHEIAGEAFTDFMQAQAQENPQLKVLTEAKLLMVIGLPVQRILEVIDILTPDMMVLGSKGRTGLSQILLGSKASQLVQMCPVTLTLVKAKN